jgi:protein arginine N-methyltransferase 3
MSIHLRADQVDFSATDLSDGESESEQDEQDVTWSDWVSDSTAPPCKSLFDDTEHPSAAAALAYDKGAHDIDFDALCAKLCEHHASVSKIVSSS